jgi:hypothetical protein
MRHDVDALWNPIQQELFDRQDEIEDKAVELLEKDREEAIEYLTGYTHRWGTEVVEKAWKLGDFLWTKYDEKF